MLIVAAPSSGHAGLLSWYAPWRISRSGLVLIVALHGALLWAALRMPVVDVSIAPAAATVLSVSLLPLAAAPPQQPPLPAPVAPTLRVPRTMRPVPLLAASTAVPAALENHVPTAPAEASPAPVAPAAASAGAAAPTPVPLPIPPRFDAAYLDNPRPLYPLLARRMGEQGRVLLRVGVDAGGKPLDVQLHTSSGSPRLDEAALEAVRRWRFVPARLGSEAVAASVLVPIVFSLKD